jgi:hypothetical protein
MKSAASRLAELAPTPGCRPSLAMLCDPIGVDAGPSLLLFSRNLLVLVCFDHHLSPTYDKIHQIESFIYRNDGDKRSSNSESSA